MASKLIQLKDENNNYLYPINAKRILSSGANLNDLYNETDTGFYEIRSGVVNAPQDWCRMIVIGGSGAAQLIITPSGLWWRMFTGSPLAWTPWKSVS